MNDKSAFEETLVQMLAYGSSYSREYCFYGYLISQCKISIDADLPAPAGVSFSHDHYTLHISPTIFNVLPIEQRIGVLKHEMLHILNNHVFRAESQNLEHLPFNYSSDCAINQDITRTHLPEGVIYPDNFPSSKKVPKGLNAEQYYELLDESKLPPELPDGAGDHDIWQTSEGIEIVKDILTEKMMQKAFAETSKAKGDLPSNYSQWLDVFSGHSKLNWKQILRRIVGNKRANTRKVLPRPYRRNPNATYLKGTVKDRIFELLFVADVSGSVGSDELVEAITETIHICKLTNTPSTLIQVDTQAHKPEKLSANTRKFERKACGGTILAPALDTAKEYHIKYDAVVVLTDGYIDESDVEAYAATGKRVIWLITSGGTIRDSMNTGKMQAVKL